MEMNGSLRRYRVMCCVLLRINVSNRMLTIYAAAAFLFQHSAGILARFHLHFDLYVSLIALFTILKKTVCKFLEILLRNSNVFYTENYYYYQTSNKEY